MTGKSTLLDILAARKSCGRVTGQVLMNGWPCGLLFRRISAYVAQEDVFVPTMTAWETLVFYATLTLPKAINQEDRTQRMLDVLQIMGLSRCRHTQVRPRRLVAGSLPHFLIAGSSSYSLMAGSFLYSLMACWGSDFLIAGSFSHSRMAGSLLALIAFFDRAECRTRL